MILQRRRRCLIKGKASYAQSVADRVSSWSSLNKLQLNPDGKGYT